MADNNFNRALATALRYEGGFSNHPADPGKATLNGVTQAVYNSYLSNRGLPRKNLSSAMANDPTWIGQRNDIYRYNYWNKIWGDDLPAGVDFVVFDGAVNSGVAQSVKWLQRALRGDDPNCKLRIDGIVGDNTLKAARDFKNVEALINDICDRRLTFMKALKTWPTFGKGWAARVEHVRKTGLAWAAEARGAAPKPVPAIPPTAPVVVPPKDDGAKGAKPAAVNPVAAPARVEDVKPTQSTSPMDATTGIMTAIATLSATLAAAQEHVITLVGNIKLGPYLLAGLAVTSVAVAAGALAYRVYVSRKNREIADAVSDPMEGASA